MADQTKTLIQARPGAVPRPVAAPPPANWEQGLINRRNSCEFQLNSMFGLLWVPVLAVYLLLFPFLYALTMLLIGVWHSRLVTRNANLIAICDYLAANDSSRYLQGWRMYV